MNKQKCSNSFRQLAGICLLVLLACIPGRGHAQTFPNPSFEANSFTVFPGYVSNNAAITGWTVSPTDRGGLNPATSSPFANNGLIPNGTNVAFLQSRTNASTLSTVITGLEIGHNYVVTFRANCRNAGYVAPNAFLSLNGDAFTNITAGPAVGGSNPYYTNAVGFRATATTAALVLSNFTSGDATLLVDDFTITDPFVVTNNNNAGPGSLRDAVALAGTPAYPTANIITFDPALSGQTIVLASEIVLSSSVTIDASDLPGGLTIDGATGTHRLFSVSTSRLVNLFGLNLTRGHGSGVASGGSGGAILNSGTLTITGCALYNNTADQIGGAIRSSGALALTNCTLSGNVAAADSGTSTFGGAIFFDAGTVTLNHCTVAGNTAAGGSSFGGGIYGTVTVINSIVAGNTAGTGADIFGAPVLFGNNIMQSVSGVPTGTGNFTNANPQLAALGTYGGPTLTRPPTNGSPAINAVVGSTLTSDQRGVLRPPGLADIGAVELEIYPALVTTAADTGLGSLRFAVAFVSNGSTITFDTNLSGATITLTSGPIVMNKSMAMDASALPGGLTLSGNSASRLVEVCPGVTAALTALNLTGASGHAVFNEGTLTLERCSVFQNNATGDGALNNQPGATLSLVNSTVASNSVSNNGGGIANGGTLFLNHATISGNSANDGGGLIIYGGIVRITNSIIAGNSGTAPDIRIYIGTLTTHGVNLLGNTNGSGLTAGPTLLTGAAQLQPLGNYGGPTRTMPPRFGSPAIDGGTDGTSFATDQRGAPRVVGPFADLGAAEFVPPPVITVLGRNPWPVLTNAAYLDTGATATNFFGIALAVTTNNPVNTAVPGTYLVTYTAADAFGNSVTNTRTVVVRGPLLEVTTTNDFGPGSLRQVLADSLDGDTILFTNTLSGTTILLTNGQLLLTRNITIDASSLSNGLALDGNAASRIFDVTNNVNVMLAGLTITNGLRYSENGGGIRNAGNLTVSNCVISGNAVRGTDYTGATVGGGGIYNSITGTLALFGSSLTGNSATGGRGGDGPSNGNGSYGCCDGGGGGRGLGGGIHNDGALTLEGSTLWANSVAGGRGGNAGYYTGGSVGNAGRGGDAYGGGIHSAGSLVLRQNTFFGNIATGGGGGNGAVDGSGGDGGHGWGGGVFNNGSLSVNQSTLTENSVFGGGLGAYQFGTPAVGSGRGGGIYNASANDVGLTNTIATGNFASFHTLAGETNLFGAHTDGGANLTNGLPLLAPFGYYGGRTPTMPPRAESPATDGCTNGTEFATDQRGTARPYGLFADIGAAEPHSFMPTVVTLPATGVTNATATLNAAINPNTNATTAWFEWGASTNYGNQTAPVFVGDGGAPLPVSVDISGFTPGITNRFRVVASNSTGIAYGNDVVFGSPVLTLDGPAVVTNECHAPFAVSLPVLANPSFEANTFPTYPGYASGNGGSISGWTISDATRIGLNTASGPFADNGPIPNGVNCAFVQSSGNSLKTLSQTITGFVTGVTYQIRFRANRRAATSQPNPTWSLDGSTFVPFNASPAAGTNGYYTNSLSFTATSNSIQLVIANQSVGDSTVLVDDFSLTPSVANSAASPVTVNGYFDPDTPGTYTLTYAGTNALGGVGTVTRTVVVQCNPVTPPVLGGATRLGDGAFQFRFSSAANTSFSILASTNVAAPAVEWTNLGPAAETPPGSGQYQFTDVQATNHPARFYRVAQP